MQPRILFLGTAGEEAIFGKQIRASGGIVIQIEDYQFILDPGPGALVRAAQTGVNLRETTAILVSHAHINHCNDVNAVIAAMTHNGLDKQGILISNRTFVYGAEGEIPYLTNFHKNCVERTIIPEAKQKIGIEHIEIHALKTQHSDPNAIGFKIFTPKFVLTYTSDTEYTPELTEQYMKSDILIMNVTQPYGMKEKHNLCSDCAEKIIKKTKPSLAVLTHFGKKMIQADPVYEARKIQKETGIQIIAAKDGMEINPETYAAEMKQKRLNLY